MALTLQECIDKIKKEYPNHFPYTFIEMNGKYVFNLVQKGYDPKKAISDMHIVDPENGYISGGISIIEFLKNPKFREAWKNPNLVANHDESIGHSSVFIGGRTRGWSVRKNQNGSAQQEPRRAAENTEDFSYDGYLCHHGIKGQSWGVRNGPPYPLDQKTHNKVVNGSSDKTSAGGPRTGLIPELISLAAIIGVDLYLNSPKVVDKKKYKIQKKFNERNRNASEDILGDIQDLSKQFSEDNPPKQISGKHSIEDDMLACNPKYKNGVIHGTSSNCTLCAFTYDMRRRGYDVAALASETGNYPDQIIKDLYVGAKEDKFKVKSFTDMFKQAADKYPEGSRGEVHLTAPFFAHSMAWEIQNHELVVIDPQRNDKYTPQMLNEFGFYPNNSLNGFIRTDNLKVNFPGMNNICAEYKSNGIETAKAENAKAKAAHNSKQSSSKASAGGKELTDAQRRKNYEEAYLKEHPNADRNSEGLKNFVDAQMNK